MKKFVAVAAVAMTLAGTAQANRYNDGYQAGQGNAWENAAVGVATNIAGIIVGKMLAPDQPQVQVVPGTPGVAAQPQYAQPAAPQVVNPYYYPPARACVTQRAPVYDNYGRIVEFIAYCANPN